MQQQWRTNATVMDANVSILKLKKEIFYEVNIEHIKKKEKNITRGVSSLRRNGVTIDIKK